MPNEALISEGGTRFTCFARRGVATELAAVGMIIEHVIGRADLTARRSFESNWVNSASIFPPVNIRTNNRLKPHDSFIIVCDVLFKDLGVGWC